MAKPVPMQFQSLKVYGEGYININAKAVTTIQVIGSEGLGYRLYLAVPGHSEPLEVRVPNWNEADSILRWWKAWA